MSSHYQLNSNFQMDFFKYHSFFLGASMNLFNEHHLYFQHHFYLMGDINKLHRRTNTNFFCVSISVDACKKLPRCREAQSNHCAKVFTTVQKVLGTVHRNNLFYNCAKKNRPLCKKSSLPRFRHLGKISTGCPISRSIFFFV